MEVRSGLWKHGLLITALLALTVLLVAGVGSFRQVPPVPARVESEDGTLIFTGDDIRQGQVVYQQHGLMDFGSVLGNGSYRGPEFTARSLRFVTDAMRDYYARSAYGRDYAGLDPDTQAQVAARVAREMKENRYDPATATLTLTPAQAHAARQLEGYWREFFVREAPGLGLPSGYLTSTTPGAAAGVTPGAATSAAPGAATDAEGGQATVGPDAVTELSRFFFWTAWVSAARRPGEQYSYTNNWPYDPAAGNTVTGASVIWSAVSVTLLILLTGLVFYLFFRYRLHWEEQPGQAALHPDDLAVSPSQRSVAKFIVLVMVLFLAQTLLGGYLSHAFVEPTFFGVDLRPLLPFPVARAWHLQLAIFWVATAWVAAGLYLAPLVSGREMRRQRALVNVLFGALVVVALGSLAGEWLGVKGVLGDLWWWMGNQGWEYLELGRVWQILLLGGLVIWWLILYRGIRGALARESDRGGLTHLLVYSGILIPFFYGFGLFNTPATNLTIAEYWRWWVIHLWVEGVFEMFTVVTAGILLGALGLVSTRSALRAAYFQLILVAASGIIGTAHHYYFVGLPEFWLALGSTFSALEVIPLTLLGVEAYEQYRALRQGGTAFPYATVFHFLLATTLWNLLGAGGLGFLINLPAVNYFEHGSFLTAAHGHAALMGVYGNLALALALFALRGLTTPAGWAEKAARLGFWGLNLSLAGMLILTLVPVGVGQLATALGAGFWVAREPAFYGTPWVRSLLWLRLLPDTTFIVLGVVPLLYVAVRAYRHRRPATLLPE